VSVRLWVAADTQDLKAKYVEPASSSKTGNEFGGKRQQGNLNPSTTPNITKHGTNH
jgi:hypothetical protein